MHLLPIFFLSLREAGTKFGIDTLYKLSKMSNECRTVELPNYKNNRIRKMAQEKDHEFLEFIVKELVDNPKDVKVERNVDEMGVLLSLTVNPQDMGQIIGREGSTAKAIRNLVRIVGLKNHARVNLKIEEPEGGRVQRTDKKETPEDIDNISL